jgi:hypothetical protein
LRSSPTDAPGAPAFCHALRRRRALGARHSPPPKAATSLLIFPSARKRMLMTSPGQVRLWESRQRFPGEARGCGKPVEGSNGAGGLWGPPFGLHGPSMGFPCPSNRAGMPPIPSTETPPCADIELDFCAVSEQGKETRSSPRLTSPWHGLAFPNEFLRTFLRTFHPPAPSQQPRQVAPPGPAHPLVSLPIPETGGGDDRKTRPAARPQPQETVPGRGFPRTITPQCSGNGLGEAWSKRGE